VLSSSTSTPFGGITHRRGFDFNNVTRATAYFKNIQDAPTFDVWLAERDLKFPPVVVAQSDICRPELSFEIELDAIMPT
jgi:hypothetical protein